MKSFSPPSARRKRKCGPEVLPPGVEEYWRPRVYSPRYRGHCPKCKTYRRILHRDHIVPLWKGGKDTPENVQLLCANCHEDKSHTDYIGFRHTDATKARISQSKKGTVTSAATRAKQSAALRGRKKTAEHLEKLSKPRSPEARVRMRKAAASFWAGLTATERKRLGERRWATRRARMQGAA